jgi:hypothetical protein
MADLEKKELINRPLKILGNLEVNGARSRTDGYAATTGITASTTQTLAGATQLYADVNVISTCANASDAVKLPDLLPGQTCVVRNTGAAVLAIWPATTARKINGGTLAAVDSSTLAANTSRTYIGDDDSINYVSF